MKTWEIERLFNDDVREKRKAGSGSFHKRGKGVKHGLSGALKTPYHFMSAKEKRKLNGEVSVTYMYETIIPLNEFRLKDIETQRAMLTRWRELYDNKKIQKELGCANSPFYKLIDTLDLPKKPRASRQGKIKKSSEVNSPKKTEVKQEIKQETLELEIHKKEEETKQIIVTKGLHLEFNGSYEVEELNKLFTKLQLLVDGETNKYNIRLSLSEIVK